MIYSLSKTYLLLFGFHGLLILLLVLPWVWFLDKDIKEWTKHLYLLQDNPPRVEPLQVDSCKQGVQDAGHHDDEGQGQAQAVQQLVCTILFCIGPNVEDKSRVFLPHLGS